MDLNVLIRGQSNASILTNPVNSAALKAEVERLLGFDGSSNSIEILGAADITAFGGSSLLPSASHSVLSWLIGGDAALASLAPVSADG